MALRPEQVKAKEYLDQQGSRRSATQLRERVAAAFTAIEEFLDHLVETHKPSVVELRELLADRRPAHGPIPASLQSPDPMSRPWPDLLDALKRVQAEAVKVLAAAPDRPTEARAEVVMVINVKRPDGSEEPLHWIEELDWKAYAIVFRLHVLDHLNQAKKVLRSVRGA